jgi:hypothetical protein
VTEESSCGWEALTGDPLPWLLDEHRPNLLWRTLVEVVGRPPGSPAVLRARGGANAAEPVATLLAELRPDGTWATGQATWARYGGPGWRLVAAAAWGADPGDPRLHAACERLLETAAGEGGFAARGSSAPSPVLTARLAQAAVELGFGRHLRVQEALAWLAETEEAWSGDLRRQAVTAVAVTAALAGRLELGRQALRECAATAVLDAVSRPDPAADRLGHPNLARTDLAEMLWALARAGVSFEPRLAAPLARLQRLQGDGGRWPRRAPRPASPPIPSWFRAAADPSCQWVTLRAVVAMNAYAVDARLPRLFPQALSPNSRS